MAAQVSLACASSATCSPDTSLHDVPLDTIEPQNDETILTGPTPSSPAGAASRKDIKAMGGGLIHLAALPPLPALLREWSHGGPAAGEKDGDDVNNDNRRQRQKQSSSPSRDRAQRTSSGTPIAVAVQNDCDQDNIDDNHNSNRQASPLWSMLQSSVAAATTTATSGTAATSNAAAVLPAAALDSPPVKVRHV